MLRLYVFVCDRCAVFAVVIELVICVVLLLFTPVGFKYVCWCVCVCLACVLPLLLFMLCVFMNCVAAVCV